jgi:TRAP-type mannitol/chloroaromatic compound transport system substrate-binding protein
MFTPTTTAERRKLLKSSLVLAAAPAVIGVPAYAQSKATVTWKVQAHWPKASSSFKDSLEWFAAELGRRTDGRFKMQLFGAGELAKDAEIYNIVKRGVVEMGTLAPAYILGEAEAMGLAYGIPGTFREPWQMAQYLKNMGGEQLVNDQLVPKGVIYRTEKAYTTELVVSKKITTLDEFKSLKLRSAGTLLDYLALAGASPTHVAGPELYQALATGVVDGAHWGAAQGAMSMKLWEVARFHMLPPLGITCDAYVFNKAAVDKLPEDLRLNLMSLADERFFSRTTEYQLKEALALTKGRETMKVEVVQFPKAVEERFAAASKEILAKETAKGPLAAKGAAQLNVIMKALGYA